ncbi:MAG TPA: hypothetical protein VNE86_06605 [Nitrososphaerales archaeon]|nr:hypothetical protein [Nitrososphaerales archaeon]
MKSKDDEELSSADAAIARAAFKVIGLGVLALLIVMLELVIPVQYVLAGIIISGISAIIILRPNRHSIKGNRLS